jgi:hypothetical protein
MTDLLELAARVEGLQGPDREVDARIAHAIKWRWDAWEEGDIRIEDRPLEYVIDRVQNSHNSIWRNLPRYTASVDHAMSLVPEGWGYGLDYAPSGSGLRFTLGSPDLEPVFVNGEAMTLPRAITAAALRARAHGGGEG